VASVQFKLDGANLGPAVTAAPYAISWTTTSSANGNHTLTAEARDAAGNVAVSAADVVTVSNTVADTSAPTVAVSSPMAGTSVSGGVPVTATASDNVAVASVQFKVDGINLGAAVTAAPYAVSWATSASSNGNHTLTAEARDAAGNLAVSQPVTVTVSNGVTQGDTTPPSVAITSPVSGSVTGTITVTATASDNVGVTRVQFKLDGVDLGPAVTTAPYRITWTTTSAPKGSHTLTAEARDAAGNVTLSAPVSVTVKRAGK
jgi:hypothetical protein